MDVLIALMLQTKSAHTTPKRIKPAQSSLSFVKEVVDASAEQLSAMVADNAHMAKMSWDVIQRSARAGIVQQIHSVVIAVNVFQNTNIAMQSYHVGMEAMSHHIFVVHAMFHKSS